MHALHYQLSDWGGVGQRSQKSLQNSAVDGESKGPTHSKLNCAV